MKQNLIRGFRLGTVTLVVIIILGLLPGCGVGGGYNGPTAPAGSLQVVAVSPKLTGSSRSGVMSAKSLDAPSIGYGYINSGAPDYLNVTLTSIRVVTAQGSVTVWNGSKALHLTGSGSVDVSDLTLTNVPAAHITEIDLGFDNQAQICGTLTAQFAAPVGSTTFYTKAAYPYNAVSHTGGSALYTDFQTGPAEATDIWLSGDNGFTVATPADYTPDANTPPTLTILFDLSRMLRFYDGQNPDPAHGGVNPVDPTNKAYFFCHSVFPYSVAAFFGTAGKVQGYQTLFNSGSEDVPGWMTVAYNAGGQLISGILIGDDDNALTIGKGIITGTNGSSSFHYNISEVDVTGFQQVAVLNNSRDASWSQPGNSRSGNVRFTLKFETP